MNYCHELQWKSFKKKEMVKFFFFLHFPKAAKRKTSTVLISKVFMVHLNFSFISLYFGLYL